MEKNYQEVLFSKNVEAQKSFMECVAEVFSAIMEEEVTTQQASCIINVIVATLMTVFPVNIPILLRIFSLVWMGVSILHLKNEQ